MFPVSEKQENKIDVKTTTQTTEKNQIDSKTKERSSSGYGGWGEINNSQPKPYTTAKAKLKDIL